MPRKLVLAHLVAFNYQMNLFVVDFGIFQIACETIKASLDKLPGYPRTQIGFITFDSTLHFYNLKVMIFRDVSYCISCSFSYFTCPY